MSEKQEKPLTMVGSPDAVLCTDDVCEVPEPRDHVSHSSTTGVQAGAHPSSQT